MSLFFVAKMYLANLCLLCITLLSVKDRQTDVSPKFVGQKCPVCNGHATLKYGTLKCHGCEGKGYILVPAEEVNGKRRH